MTKIKFNVPARLTILGNLPEKGDVYTMITTRQIRKLIDFSAEEVESFEIKQIDNRIVWNNSKVTDNEYELSSQQIKFLVDMVNKLDEQGLVSELILDFVTEILAHDNVEVN